MHLFATSGSWWGANMQRIRRLGEWYRLGATSSDPLIPLFYDVFTTAIDPLGATRAAEPGPGDWDITQISTKLYISSQQLMSTFNIASGVFDRVATTQDNWARVAGLAVYIDVNTAENFILSFTPTPPTRINIADCNAGISIVNTTSIQYGELGSYVTIAAADTTGEYWIILREYGSIIVRSAGANWQVEWVQKADNDSSNMYVDLNFYRRVVEIDTVSAWQLPAPWDTDPGPVSYFDATPTTGDTDTATADGLMYFEWTPVAAETLSLYFRRTDDDNTYRLDCNQAAGTIKLYRRDTAVDTELDAGKTQTWTATNPYRIGIIFDGGDIKTFVQNLATTGVIGAKHSVTGESFNLSETGIKSSGYTTGANWECFPRLLSGEAALILENRSNF